MPSSQPVCSGAAPRGSEELQWVNKQETMPQTQWFLFFPPHLLSLSQDTEASELFVLLQKKKKGRHRQRWGLTESHTKYNILSGHFPQVTAVHTGGKMLPDQEGPISPPLCSGINSDAICRSKAHQAQWVCFGVIQEAITFCKYWGDL